MFARRWAQGRWFAVALLLALASALVPALCVSGIPSSRITGSAFDPATNAVALRGRAQSIVRTEAVKESGGAREALAAPRVLPLAILVTSPTEIAATSLIRPDTGHEPTLAPRAKARLRTSAQPRAPPAHIV